MKMYEKTIYDGSLKFRIHVEGAKDNLPARAFIGPPGDADPMRDFIVPEGNWDIEIEMAPLTNDGMICIVTRIGKGSGDA